MDNFGIALRIINKLNNTNCGQGAPVSAESVVKEILDAEYGKRIEELENALRSFAIECPFIFDDATIPKAGIEAAPQQVVVNMSVGWLRIVKAREALGIKTGIP